jgi:predicted  nucleic acid-binding Zn-ribbon protein
MNELLLNFLLENKGIPTRIGGNINVVELLHTTTINSLNDIRTLLDKNIERFSSQDEWTKTDSEQEKLANAKTTRELVNLVIGYKRYNMELTEIKNKQEALTAQIEALKESQKTPDDKIAELQKELDSLEATEF